ncbi:MAG: hypothetical protein QOE44_2498, partial [Solirubrobacteraceae bacterium]|nr:hypothetical protein [Solirubrobacteraceae bacterium]
MGGHPGGPTPASVYSPWGMAETATIQVVMPQMGDSVSEGTILEWHKAAGDAVTADETIVEISTDKVDAEVAAPATGTILSVHGAEGDTVAVGAVLAEIVPGDGPGPGPGLADGGGTATHSYDEPADAAGEGAPVHSGGLPAGNGVNGSRGDRAASRPNGTGPDPAMAPTSPAHPADPAATPVARRIAAAEGVDLGHVSGRGASGRIMKADVLEAVRNGGRAGPTPTP